jgi:hypothetical protein
LEAGGLRFSDTAGDADKVIIEGKYDTTYRPVGSVDSDTQITLGGGAITFSEGDRVINLGKDGGSTEPDYKGYASGARGEFIYTDPVDTGTPATENKVTTDSTDGEYGFWVSSGRVFDLHVMDSDGKLGTNSETKEDESAGIDGSQVFYVTATSGTF